MNIHLQQNQSSEAKGAIISPPKVLILAGSVRSARSAPLAQAIGIPVAALPIDASQSLLSGWLRTLSRVTGEARIGIAIAELQTQSFYERVAEESGNAARIDVWVDRNMHRGTGGIVRDYTDDRWSNRMSGAGGLLVIECSTQLDFDCDAFVAGVDASAEATVLASEDMRPCGVIHLSQRAIDRIPAVGYYDLKEQLVPTIVQSSGRVRPVFTGADPSRVGDITSYLSMLESRARNGASMISDDARIDAMSELQGWALVARGADIRSGALVANSAILPGAVVGEGAVVARSVVPPGAYVPPGALVVDRVFASLESNERLQT
jgi:hypothetical protein